MQIWGGKITFIAGWDARNGIPTPTHGAGNGNVVAFRQSHVTKLEIQRAFEPNISHSE